MRIKKRSFTTEFKDEIEGVLKFVGLDLKTCKASARVIAEDIVHRRALSSLYPIS